MDKKQYTPKHLQLGKIKINSIVKHIKNSIPKRYTSQKMMKKIEQCLLASSIGLTSLFINSLVTLQSKNNYDNVDKQSVYGELQNSSVQKIIKSEESKKLNKITIQDASESQDNINTSTETPKEEIDSMYEIENVYGGEFSASENGISTKEEILYVINQTKWSQDEKDHIKNNLMEGLLYIQKKYDIRATAALTIFHHEGFCGLYHYNTFGEIRVANVQAWDGETGVKEYHEAVNDDGSVYYTCVYNTWFDAVKDFGEFVRFSEALKGAKTWYELQFHKGYEGIFNGAYTEDRYTYYKLEEYAKEYRNLYEIKVGEDSAEVTIYDIHQAVEDYTTDDIYQETETLKSIIQGENNQSQEDEKEID